MSDSIDRRVVEMRFDNSDFLRKSNDTLNALKKLKESISFTDTANSTKNATQALKNLKDGITVKSSDNSLSGVSSILDKIKTKFSDLKTAGSEALLGLKEKMNFNDGKSGEMPSFLERVKTKFSELKESGSSALEKLKARFDLDSGGSGGLIDDVREAQKQFSALDIIGTTALVNITNKAVNLGTHLLKSLTIDQVKSGFDEYELKMNSIQTIMSGTGEKIETVNKYLNELNTYSDKTIYSFSDMTSNIGKFTNAGISLKDSTKAIQGVSNVAALAGANANEASRAMYNFSQALSTGSVKLIDWKSIENANMATKGFKQQLIDTAVVMGTVKKTSDGYVATTSKTTKQNNMAFDATKNFNSTLSAEWMTTEVLTQTLQNYSHNVEEMTDVERKEYEQQLKKVGYNEEQIKQIEELGAKAFAAATEIKTFHQLLDTLKESVGSGWAQTFEIIFGNLDEAKKLWTGISTYAENIISTVAKARNKMFQDWKDKGGRDLLFEGFSNIAHTLENLFAPIKNAFSEIFGEANGTALYNFSKKFDELTLKIADFSSWALELQPIFETLFKVIKSCGEAIGYVSGKTADLLASGLDRVGEYFYELKGENGESGIKKTADEINELGESFNGLGKGLSGLAGGTLNVVGKALANLFSFVGKVLSLVDFKAILKAIQVAGLMKFLDDISKSTNTLTDSLKDFLNSFKGLKEIPSSLTGALDGLTTSFKNLLATNSLVNVIMYGTAAALLAKACVMLADIPVDKMTNALTGLSAIFFMLTRMSKSMKNIKTRGIVKLSLAILVLAQACATLAEIDNMGKGLGGLAAMLTEIVLFCKAFTKINKIFKLAMLGKAAAGLILLGAALNLMIRPIKELGALDTEALEQGLLAVGVVVAGLGAFSAIMTKSEASTVAKFGVAAVLMGAGINLIAEAIISLSTVEWDEIKRGLAAIAGSLAIIVAFGTLIDDLDVNVGKLVAASATIAIMAVGINMLAVAVAMLSNVENVQNGIGALAASLLAIVMATAMMNEALPGAAAMIVVAAAITALAPAIIMLSQLNLLGLGIALGALAGSVLVFAGAAVLVKAAIPAMLGAASALAIFGASVLLVGAGIGAAGAGIALFVKNVSESGAGLGKAIEDFAVGSANALIETIKVFGDSSEAIGEAVVKIGLSILKTVDELAPKFGESAALLLVAFLEGINSQLYKIMEVAFNIIYTIVDSINDNIKPVVDAAFNLVINLCNGLAASISENAPIVRDAMANLALSLIEAIARFIPGIGDEAAEYIKKYREGIASGKKSVDTVSKTIAKSAENNLKIKNQEENGKNAVRGLSKGMSSMKDSLRSTASTIAGIVDSVIRKKNEIKSPSRRLARTGKYMMQGLIGGLDSLTGEYQRKADNIATYMLDSVNSSASGINSAFNQALPTNLDFATSANIASNMKIDATGVVDMRRQEQLFEHMNQLMETLADNIIPNQMTNNITVGGAEDPALFADSLLRSFKLNARSI